MQVLDVTGFLKYAVQAAAMFETRFNSVERLMAYFELPQEAPRLIEATKCAAAHPMLALQNCSRHSMYPSPLAAAVVWHHKSVSLLCPSSPRMLRHL